MKTGKTRQTEVFKKSRKSIKAVFTRIPSETYLICIRIFILVGGLKFFDGGEFLGQTVAAASASA